MGLEPATAALAILSALEKLIKQRGSTEIERDYIEQLRAQLAELKAENAALKARVVELEQANTVLANQLRKNARHDRLDAKTEEILVLYYTEDKPISAEAIARLFKLQSSTAKYHNDQLEKRELILWKQLDPFEMETETAYEITDKGRAYVMENNLIPEPPKDVTYT